MRIRRRARRYLAPCSRPWLHRDRPQPHARRLHLCLLLTLAWSGIAVGEEAPDAAGDLLRQSNLIPYGAVQAEHNSNIFALSGRNQARLANGSPTLADTVLRYVAGVDARLPISQQKLHAIFEGRQLQFLHFSRLDHSEYLLSGGLDWRLSSIIDGALDYSRERRMAAFADRMSTQLAIENEQIGSGTVNVAIAPEWRLETGLRTRQLDSPLPGFPDFSLKENTASAGLKYLAGEEFTAGVFGAYLDGSFSGITDSGNFHQEDVGVTAEYSIVSLSRIHAELGYSRRIDQTSGSGALSAFTGVLAYRRDLSGKTSAEIRGVRRVSSYVAGASSVIETGAAGALTWKPTQKIVVNLNYQWTKSHFQQAPQQSVISDRNDNGQIASVRVAYQALPWLSVHPYGSYQLRHSTVGVDSFNAKVVGVELRARFD